MIWAHPRRKGEFEVVSQILARRGLSFEDFGELRVEIDATGCPEMEALVVARGQRWDHTTWVLHDENYLELPKKAAVERLMWEVWDLLKPGGMEGFKYTNDELVHRALWLVARRRTHRRFAEKLGRLIASGRRNEARALLLAKELSLLEAGA